MEGVRNLKWSLALVLVLIITSFSIFDTYHVNLLLSYISSQSHAISNYGLPSHGSSLVGSPAVVPHNRSPVNEEQKQERRGIPKVEIDLRRARASIRRAVLHGEQKGAPGGNISTSDIYKNAVAFHQSYREMWKRFKIFLYRDGEPPLVHIGPCKNIYTTEGRFIDELELGNRFLTSNPEDAHVFFLPFSVTLMVTYIYKPYSYDVKPLKRFMADYIHVVANKYSFWNRSQGADHFMLSCHDWAPMASRGNPLLYNNSIRVLCNANVSEGFNPTKDVTLPEMNLYTGKMTGLVGGQSALERPIFAFFAGGNHGPVRPLLFKHWKEGTDSDIHVSERVPSGLSYHEFMKKSKYCLCPSGYEVASPRIVEAIYSECVPVIISKNYVLPFSDVLNWTSFSVQVPLSEIPNLKAILQSIPVNKYVQMQTRVKQVQKHFILNQPPKPQDMFHMILHSIWLRRLNIQIS
eukprot:PITA_26721